MALTKENYRQLIKLQEQDKVLDALQAEIDKVPKEIEALRQALEARKKAAADAKAKGTALQLKKKEKELELVQKEDAAKKHGMELNQVKTNEAFKALQSEIDKAKAQAGDLETEILTIMEEIDRAVREEKDAAAQFKSHEGEVQASIKALEDRKAETEAKAAQEKSKRGTLAEGIPAEMMRNYDYLRKRRQGTALAPVRGTMCGACHITLPPQVIVEVTKGTCLMTCESCQRILYKSEALAAPA